MFLFFVQSANFCLLIVVCSKFIFNVVIDNVGLKSIILLFVFCMYAFLCLDSSITVFK